MNISLAFNNREEIRQHVDPDFSVCIPYGKQNINQKDIDYVIKVLKSDFLTQGPMVPAF